MKASHTDQLDLLELQKLDQKESALRHKRDSHPAHATVREFAGRVADLQRVGITKFCRGQAVGPRPTVLKLVVRCARRIARRKGASQAPTPLL